MRFTAYVTWDHINEAERTRLDGIALGADIALAERDANGALIPASLAKARRATALHAARRNPVALALCDASGDPPGTWIVSGSDAWIVSYSTRIALPDSALQLNSYFSLGLQIRPMSFEVFVPWLTRVRVPRLVVSPSRRT